MCWNSFLAACWASAVGWWALCLDATGMLSSIGSTSPMSELLEDPAGLGAPDGRGRAPPRLPGAGPGAPPTRTQSSPSGLRSLGVLTAGAVLASCCSAFSSPQIKLEMEENIVSEVVARELSNLYQSNGCIRGFLF